MKKVLTTYSNTEFSISVNEEYPEHISVHQFGEPCSGILKHWGTRADIIKELEAVIRAVKKI